MKKKIKNLIIGGLTLVLLTSFTYKLVKNNKEIKLNIKKHKELDIHSENIVAHRGYSSYYPDNSYESVEAALNSDCTDLIEIDVRFTKDMEIVINHDSFINISDISIQIDELIFKDTKTDLILLKDFLIWYSFNKPLIIDVKTNKVDENLSNHLNKLLNNHSNLVYIQSDCYEFLEYMNILYPNYKYLYIINSKDDLKKINNNNFYGYTVKYSLFDDIIVDNNKIYLIYTINSLNKYLNLINNDNYRDNMYIITDNPDYICSLENKKLRK